MTFYKCPQCKSKKIQEPWFAILLNEIPLKLIHHKKHAESYVMMFRQGLSERSVVEIRAVNIESDHPEKSAPSSIHQESVNKSSPP